MSGYVHRLVSKETCSKQSSKTTSFSVSQQVPDVMFTCSVICVIRQLFVIICQLPVASSQFLLMNILGKLC